MDSNSNPNGHFGDGNTVVANTVPRPRVHAFQLRVRDDDVNRLFDAALARQTSPNKLAALILRTVLQDNLIAAVLDDDGSFERRN